MTARYSATRTSLRTASIMLVFTLVFTTLMAATYGLTRPAIQASMQEAQMRLIDEVLPPGSYDNDLLDDVVRVGPTPALGLDDGGRIWRARRAGQPVALIVETAATDGYAGRIAMVVAINTNGLLSGVRVTAHKETPGLGDYIDPKKDRRKDMPWIGQFSIASWKDVNTAEWALRKDGGKMRSGQPDEALGEIGVLVRAVEPPGIELARGEVRFQKPVMGSDVWPCLADEAIPAGARVRVLAVDGQLLKVGKF